MSRADAFIPSEDQNIIYILLKKNIFQMFSLFF